MLQCHNSYKINAANTFYIPFRVCGFDGVVSTPLQPANANPQHKELYAYLFRLVENALAHVAVNILSMLRHPHRKKVASAYIVHDQHQYPQAKDFYRPPFIVQFHVQVPELSCMPRFVLIGIHIKPDRANYEINELANVYYRISKQTHLQNALILGDLNADCNFFRKGQKLRNNLYKRRHIFKWLVKDRWKTNALAKSSCAYDR